MLNRKGKFELAAGVFFLVFLLGLMPTLTRAQSTGSISGRVTDNANVGIEAVYVRVYNAEQTRVGDAFSNAQGNYVIDGLEPGIYKAYFYTGVLEYFSEWYSDKSDYSGADPIEVTAGNATSGINVQLQAVGKISGRVTDESGTGIEGCIVEAFSPGNNFYVEYAYSDSDGYFNISYLPTGTYEIYFSPHVAPGYVPEWYNDKSDRAEADPVAVTAGLVTSNINARLALAGGISGRVMDSYGAAIPFAGIRAYDVGDSSFYAYGTNADANGYYELADVAAGSYKVLFSREGYHDVWYDDKDGFAAADAVTIVSGITTPNIDGRLVKMTSLDLSKQFFIFAVVRGGASPAAQTTIVSNSGEGILDWTAAPQSQEWLTVSPSAGQGDGVITIGIAGADLPAGDYYGSVFVTDPQAWNSPKQIGVTLNVIDAADEEPPFGSFDTPLDGATVASAIPVTGWALDDTGNVSVKIYLGSGDNDRIYIGDAIFVEGARPDIEADYPVYRYPLHDRAGWGYMLLTNMLPNGGNGSFSLLAYATDLSGHEVLLGSKTIVCNNLNAVKPFGAIDTPTQGGIASGNAFFNFGWALTPQPNTIPVDGSTINVWVDGLPLGHPVYDNYRADIATLFPGYANSNGAVGVFTLDTTGYTNGVHTIEWSATDTGGNTDGIGSRYFTIQNLAGSPGAIESAGQADPLQREDIQETAVDQTVLDPAGQTISSRSTASKYSEIASMPEDVRSPVFIKRGLALNAPAEMVMPDTDGTIRITVPEVTRVAVYLNENDAEESETEMIVRGKRIRDGVAALHSQPRDQSIARGGNDSRYESYQLVDEELRPLPIGASFDPESGAFFWQPGPGFRGEFRFVIADSAGQTKKIICVTIF